MRAGEVQFKSVHAGFLAAFDDFDPGVLAIFLHDGSNQDAVGKHVFALFEFVEPDLERPVADQFDVLPADDLLAVLAHQLGVTRRDVDDLGRVEADRFGDDGAPPFLERFANNVQVGAGRAGADDKRIGQLQSVNGRGKCRHKFWVMRQSWAAGTPASGRRSAPTLPFQTIPRLTHYNFGS